jgi:WD40 repeat protein
VARVFLSHAVADDAVADDLFRWLVDAGHEAFIDQDPHDGFGIGVAWRERLYARLRWADVVVCLVTPAYVASRWCFAEIAISQAQGTRLLPLSVEPDVRHPLLDGIHHGDYAGDPTGARLLLDQRLREVDAGGGGGGWSDGLSPFPGLSPFDADRQRVFFGRSAESEELAGLLRTPVDRSRGELVLVTGASGCGKSSLIRAGVRPLLAADPDWWTLAPVVAGKDPLVALARELAFEAKRTRQHWDLADVRRRVANGELADVVDELLLTVSGIQRRRKLLIILDQMEELLTTTPARHRTGFFEALAPALSTSGSIAIVGGMRSESVGSFLADPAVADIATRIYSLSTMSTQGLASVVIRPSRWAGIGIDEELAARMVGDTATGDGLGLLAATLRRMSLGISRGGRLSTRRYEQIGGVRGILSGQADHALVVAMAASRRGRDEVLAGLLRLVGVDDHGQPVGRPVARDRLPEPVMREFAVFVEARLLVSDTEDGVPVIRLAHDALLSAWQPMAAAVARARPAMQVRRGVEQAAAQWIRDARSPRRLWERGQLATLAAAVGLRQVPVPVGQRIRTPLAVRPFTTEIELDGDARDFIGASVRRDRARRVWAVAVLATLTVFAVSATMIAIDMKALADQQRNVAIRRSLEARILQRTTEIKSLVAQSQTEMDVDARKGIRLALAAFELGENPGTTANLVRLLMRIPHVDRTISGVANAVWSLSLAPDGHTLAVGGDDGTTRLWNIDSPALTPGIGPPIEGLGQEPSAHATERSVAFSPNGHRLATGGADGTVALWDVGDPTAPNLRPLAPPDGAAPVYAMAFSPKGGLLAAGRGDGTATLWTLTQQNSRPVTIRSAADAAAPAADGRLLAFSPSGRTLAIGSGDGVVALWDVTDPAQPRRVASLSRNPGSAEALAFTPDGSMIVTGTAEGKLAWWDMHDRRAPTVVRSVPTGSTDAVTVVSVAPDGRHVAAGNGDGTVRIWETAGSDGGPPPVGTQPLVLTGHTGAVSAAQFTPDGKRLVTGGADGTVTVWDVADELSPRRFGPPLRLAGSGVASLSFTGDGRMVAAGGADGSVVMWDIVDRSRIGPVWQPPSGRRDHGGSDNVGGSEGGNTPGGPPGAAGGTTEPVSLPPVVFAPDDGVIATGGTDGSVLLWDAYRRANIHVVGRLSDGGGRITSWAFSPDGRVVATGCDDGAILLWDVSDPAQPNRITASLAAYGQAVSALSFSPDGHLLAAAGTDGVQLWDAEDPAQAHRIGLVKAAVGPGWTVTFSPDGHELVALREARVLRWDLTTVHESDPTEARTTGWPLTTAQTLLTNGVGVITAGGDTNAMKIWDLTPEEPLQIGPTLAGGDAPARVLDFSRDGNVLAVGGSDGTVLLWDFSAFSELWRDAGARACAMVGRGLTHDEWNQYAASADYEQGCRP